MDKKRKNDFTNEKMKKNIRPCNKKFLKKTIQKPIFKIGPEKITQ